MSTSLLYHGFGLKSHHYHSTAYSKGRIIFTVKQDRWSFKCPACNCRDVILRGSSQRLWRSLPIGSKPVLIQMALQRVECRKCAQVRRVQIPFADHRRTYTHGFERYVLELSRYMTIVDIARHLNVGWDLVKDIQKRYLQRRFAKPSLKKARIIAIDEITIGKGHRYLTVVLNLLTGAVIFVGDGRGADALDGFWKRVKRSKINIEAVAIDMSPAYISAVEKNLPEATIVFDHFHIIKMFNDKLAQLRRQLQAEAQQAHKKVLKGTRWLLLKNPENLNADKNEHQRLQQALELNQPLATAYYLKEELRQLWNQINKKKATAVLTNWIAQAKAAGIKILTQLASSMAEHAKGILAYYDYRISTGPLEGTNNKIKTLQRQAYGFRDHEFFKLKIYALHTSKYALVG